MHPVKGTIRNVKTTHRTYNEDAFDKLVDHNLERNAERARDEGRSGKTRTGKPLKTRSEIAIRTKFVDRKRLVDVGNEKRKKKL